ncbi:MAG: GH1 family beta-glucosidase [Acidimicrobiia bacterium]|nr:MAG: GH1 family beta-glucosidase [Acidimicrobiia bacterium]
MAHDDSSFRWGVGTSAFQIEGAWDEDGKGESIWDRFLHESGTTANGDETCDHYHRLESDLDLLATLGVNSYRFSTSWPRVIPRGTGATNEKGLAFYDRLVDGLLERNIEPWLTLYHWDLPQHLQDRGGWGNRDVVDWFVEYASVMVEHFGDRVSNWITVNEPWVSSFLGHHDGVFAPGLTDWNLAITAAHHQLLAHGAAVRTIRQAVPEARIGIALDCRPAYPLSSTAADLAATSHFDGFRNRWFFDPVFGKGYPSDIEQSYATEGRFPSGLVREGDMRNIAEPLDFLGVNYYTSLGIDASSAERDHSEATVGAPAQIGFTEMGWKIDPAALGKFLRRIDTEWAPPSIIVTENGASFSDSPGPDGSIHDDRRIAYLESHISELDTLRASGIPIDGYFVWSFLDNLEWVSGFDQRFGLVYVDHDTQRRTVKDSGLWYRDLIEARRSTPTD